MVTKPFTSALIADCQFGRRWVFSGLLLALIAPTMNAWGEDQLEQLSWLTGHWQQEHKGRLTEEVWLAPRGNLMVGVNRSVTPSGRASFEYLRIEVRGQAIVYVASPGGKSSTAFTLRPEKAESKQVAVFENRQHDFPQVIRYEREGDRLTATVEGTIDGRQRRLQWTWSRTALPAPQ